MTRARRVGIGPALAAVLLGCGIASAEAQSIQTPQGAPPDASAGAGGQPGGDQAPSAGAEKAKEALAGTSDWPCVQRKVETLTVTQVWDGPPIDNVKGWFREPEVNTVVTTLANRRVPLEEAEKALETFAKSLPEPSRDEKLTLVFAGVFDTLQNQRKSIVHGIEKYLRAQRERAAELERQGTAIVKLEHAAKTDEKAAKELEDARTKFDWTQRIFHDRQTNIPLACEVPVLIEERLFAVSRAIRALMTS